MDETELPLRAEPMGAEARKQYEREHGTGPLGYRGTGALDWFQLPWPERAPCVTCGQETDRWHIVAVRGSLKRSTFVYDQFYAQCWPCERPAAIAVLEQRQQNPELGAAVKASEAAYLAELVAEQMQSSGSLRE